ncbi:MAG: aldolase/citrate lyase family protein [Rhizobiaceae bacterium]
MIPNRLRQLWAEGKPAVNGWLSIGSAFTAEIMAAQGYDSLTIDLQHGLVGYDPATNMLQAMRSSGVTPLVRVPWLEPGIIMKSLDAGAYGVICPMINTRRDAERLVSYVRYPPDGTRSFGPTRANFSAGPDYGASADREILCLAMIETHEAYDNVDAIASTPGLDGIYIGPADLTLSLSGKRYPIGFDRQEPEIIDAIRHILDRCRANGIRAGLHCGGSAYAAEAVSWGFNLVTVPGDVRLLAGAAHASVADTRRLIGRT